MRRVPPAACSRVHHHHPARYADEQRPGQQGEPGTGRPEGEDGEWRVGIQRWLDPALHFPFLNILVAHSVPPLRQRPRRQPPSQEPPRPREPPPPRRPGHQRRSQRERQQRQPAAPAAAAVAIRGWIPLPSRGTPPRPPPSPVSAAAADLRQRAQHPWLGRGRERGGGVRRAGLRVVRRQRRRPLAKPRLPGSGEREPRGRQAAPAPRADVECGPVDWAGER